MVFVSVAILIDLLDDAECDLGKVEFADHGVADWRSQ